MAHKNSSNWSPYTARKKAQAKASNSPSKASGSSSRAGARPSQTAMPSTKPHGPKTFDKPGARHRRNEENFTLAQADDRVFDIFRNHGFGHYPHEKRRELTRFYQLLMANQENENFTRLLTLRDVAIKHFIDSLMVAELTKLVFPLMDMGTGPGFPGIPLKIHFPDERIILAEGVQRRVNFLKHVREEMQLKKLDIIGRNINETCMYPVQGVITRAVEDARNTLGNVLYSVQTGGRVYLMKGPNVDPEIPVALKTWGEYFELENDFKYELPKSPHQRRLLVFRKIKPAPLRDLDRDIHDAWDADPGSDDL